MPRFLDVDYAVTTSAGSGSVNTHDWMTGMICGIEVLAPSSTTTQTVAIIDRKNVTTWKANVTGSQLFVTKFPNRGIATIQLTGATSNGANVVRLLADFE